MGLIEAHELTQAAGDNQQLKPMTQAIRAALDEEVDTVVADAGYPNSESTKQVQSMEDRGRALESGCLQSGRGTVLPEK